VATLLNAAQKTSLVDFSQSELHVDQCRNQQLTVEKKFFGSEMFVWDMHGPQLWSAFMLRTFE